MRPPWLPTATDRGPHLPSTHRIMRLPLISGALLLATIAAPALAQQEEAVATIVDEGMNRSQIPMIAHDLLDRIGPRLTNSPGMRRAEDWAMREMAEIGLSNVRKEGFEFGRGWEAVSSEVWMVTPRPIELTAIPIAWTPGTEGVLRGEVIVAPMTEEAHFEAYRGKLAGKIVMVDLPGTGDQPTTPAFRRLDPAQIAERNTYAMPEYDPEAANARIERQSYALKLDTFLREEGALARVEMSGRDGKLLHGSGYTFITGQTPTLPAIEVAAEDYRRLARLAKTGPAPEITIESNVRFFDDDPMAYNIIGEIPGTDRNAGYVMAGAHFDSWAAGDGAVDNGAGSVAILEAARILNATGARPKRTIRFALWSGEEQGLLGSLAYVRQHLATRTGENDVDPALAYYAWDNLWPLETKPGYADLKAYFNIDNGSGKLRGVHAEGNIAAEPLLRKWLSSFASMGAGTVVTGSTGGTDHVFLQRIGLPGFQFIQDPLDYSARLHHTNIDTYDHLQQDDLRQMATVLAGVLLQAADDEETLPREPLPTQPTVTDPFQYKLPDQD